MFAAIPDLAIISEPTGSVPANRCRRPFLFQESPLAGSGRGQSSQAIDRLSIRPWLAFGIPRSRATTSTSLQRLVQTVLDTLREAPTTGRCAALRRTMSTSRAAQPSSLTGVSLSESAVRWQ